MKKLLFSLCTLLTMTMQAQERGLLTGEQHEDVLFGIVGGYINKYWHTDFGTYAINENLWGQQNKRIHGVQVGAVFQPCLPIGLGVHTGLFYEYYYSVSQAVKDAGYDDFKEHNLYLPLHLMWRVPLTKDISLSPFGGLGFNLAVAGSYERGQRIYYYDQWGVRHTQMDNYVASWQQYDGEWPKRFNAQWECGLNLRIKFLQVGFTYSRGLTNHKFYEGHKTQQNKLAFSIGLVMDMDVLD